MATYLNGLTGHTEALCCRKCGSPLTDEFPKHLGPAPVLQKERVALV
jgi:hypothetical protein